MSQTSEYLERRHGECLQKARGIDELLGDRVPELLRYIDAQLRDTRARKRSDKGRQGECVAVDRADGHAPRS